MVGNSENIKIQSNNDIPAPEGKIDTSRAEDITVRIEKTANHTEISIMKSQWDLICTKINRIQLGGLNINFKELVIGASIPYIFDVISSYRNGENPDYFPLIICILLYIFVGFLVSKVTFLQGDNSEGNTIHLQEIKEIIQGINESSVEK